MMADDRIPVARVHEGWWQRARSFVLVGPQRATDGWLMWALTQALVTAILHVAYFLVVLLTLSWHRANIPTQLLLGMLVLIGTLLFAGIQWVVTLASMLVVGQLGRWLGRMPRRLASALGAIVVGFASIVIEPVGGVLYHALAHELTLWTWGFWLIAAGVGALWGAWLPAAWSSVDLDRNRTA